MIGAKGDLQLSKRLGGLLHSSSELLWEEKRIIDKQMSLEFTEFTWKVDSVNHANHAFLCVTEIQRANSVF